MIWLAIAPFVIFGGLFIFALCKASARGDAIREGWAESAQGAEANERRVPQAFADYEAGRQVWIRDGQSSALPYDSLDDRIRDTEDGLPHDISGLGTIPAQRPQGSAVSA